MKDRETQCEPSKYCFAHCRGCDTDIGGYEGHIIDGYNPYHPGCCPCCYAFMSIGQHREALQAFAFALAEAEEGEESLCRLTPAVKRVNCLCLWPSCAPRSSECRTSWLYSIECGSWPPSNQSSQSSSARPPKPRDRALCFAASSPPASTIWWSIRSCTAIA